jgi:hypothetical protein
VSAATQVGWLVEAGVRRSVAAYRAGKADILADIVVRGALLRTVRVSLDGLFTTKSAIPRDSRSITKTEYPTVVLGTDPPPIQISPLYDANRVKYLTPIPAVQLV